MTPLRQAAPERDRLVGMRGAVSPEDALKEAEARQKAQEEERRVFFISSQSWAEQQERERRILVLERAVSDRIGRELKENEKRGKVA